MRGFQFVCWENSFGIRVSCLRPPSTLLGKSPLAIILHLLENLSRSLYLKDQIDQKFEYLSSEYSEIQKYCVRVPHACRSTGLIFISSYHSNSFLREKICGNVLYSFFMPFCAIIILIRSGIYSFMKLIVVNL